MVVSEQDDLALCRKKLFIYRMTVNQGCTRWFHLSVDFSTVDAPDKVISEYKLTDWQGSSHTIRAEGRIVDGRFICVFRELGGDQLSCVYLFPYFRIRRDQPGFGVCLHETWAPDAPDCLSRAIIHDAPLAGWEKNGLVDEETGNLLDDMWEAGFLATHLTLERSGHKVE